jgi:hypothetical protein
MDNKAIRYYCTCFDRFFLPRALALHASLVEHDGAFILYAFCHDDESFRYLCDHPRKEIVPIPIADVELNDEGLRLARSNRSRIEFYFTCTPLLCLYVFETYQQVDLVTYLDADLFFFSDPQPLFDEFGGNSIGIIAHNYAFGARRLLKYGTYNVGLLMFRRDEQAIECLRWWRDRCIEWCFDRLEDGKFADQKYLDEWPKRFRGVIALQHKGANVAGWNIRNFLVSKRGGRIFLDAQPLIFFHFAGFREVRPYLFRAGFSGFYVRPGFLVKRYVFEPYINGLKRHAAAEIGKRIRKIDFHRDFLIQFFRNFVRIVRGVLFGDYLLYYKGRIW